MLWSVKSCGKCGGDLIREDDEWRCIHSGRYSYPNVYPKVDQPLTSKQVKPERGYRGGGVVGIFDTLGDVVEM